jgi:hypothetical protein
MREKRLRPWTPDIDPATIPDEVLRSIWAARSARMRKSYSGGTVWSRHNPDVPGCRCARCIARREKEK